MIIINKFFLKEELKKKAQGLQISTVILAILGIVILFILIGIVTGRIQWVGKGLQQVTGEHPQIKTECEKPVNLKNYGESCNQGQTAFYRVSGMPPGKICCISDSTVTSSPH